MIKGLQTKRLKTILIGLAIILLSLIAIIDVKGYIGGILSYCFLFLCGDFYILPLLFILLLGVMLIKNNKIKINIPLIAVFIIINLIMIFNGSNDYLVKDVTNQYVNMFRSVKPPFFEYFKFGSLNGGFIGFYLYACLRSIIGKNGVNILLLILFIITFMLALKPLINLFVNLFYNIDDKQQKNKIVKEPLKDYDEIVNTNVNNINPVNNFENYNMARHVEVTDLDPISNEKKNEYSSTLFNDLSFNKQTDYPSEDLKENKVTNFNIFSDDLSFKKEDKQPVSQNFNCFNDDLESSFNKSNNTNNSYSSYNDNVSLNSIEEEKEEDINNYNDIDRFDIEDEFKEENIPSYENNETKVSVNDVFNEEPLNHGFKEFDETNNEDKNVNNSMNIFKQESINEFKDDIEEDIVSEYEEEKEEEIVPIPTPVVKHPYKLPPLSLLDDVVNEDDEQNRMEAEVKGVRLNQKLQSLGINAKVIDSIVAPSFTRFIIEVANDVKLSAFNNIKQDVMMALAAEKITVLAPIPGTIYVGIEIPNVKRSVVSFKEVFKDIPFKDRDEKLLAVLGKDIVGKAVTIKINKTPHLLIAGTTGSGKSVCINTIIASLIMRTSYEDVKLILVDPKRVEMAIYGEIPHLLCPVINDPIKATVALNKVVEVMDERYKMFENEGSLCRTIESYNRIAKQRGEKPLPYIVMIIDELSDLMLVAGKDVEASILRITQLARACGIHLIVATQRPSVDVITGVIKANLPSRIAFAVSTSADSRTILDAGGAEDLLGRGDSLVALSGDLTMQRVQGAYVSDEEILNIVEYVTKQRKPVFDPRFMNLEPKPRDMEDFSCEGLATDDGDDDLYEMIVNFLKTQKTASTSSLQSHFRIGYPKARRMIEILEENGVISAPNGSKGRKVLINNNFDD